jgi:hypothetical protein
MSEETAKPKLPQQWRVESVKTTDVSVDCPACHKQFSFDIGAFEKKPTQKIEGLIKTDQVVRRTYRQNFLAFVAALIVYYYAHQWVNGEGTPLNQGILVPVFIAVFVYSILKPFFSAGLFGGKGIPIHVYKCDQCQSDVFVACDGKSLAYPVLEETKGGATYTVPAGAAHLETPCRVSITRLPSVIGAAMNVNVLLNSDEVGILKNGKTIDFNTEYSVNEITVNYVADGASRTIKFEAEAGGSVNVTLKYSGAVLSVT